MRNFTPNIQGEVHLCNLDTMQRGADGPKNILNGPIGIDITFSSLMSVAICLQPDNRRLRIWRQPGQAERNSVQRVQQVVVP